MSPYIHQTECWQMNPTTNYRFLDLIDLIEFLIVISFNFRFILLLILNQHEECCEFKTKVMKRKS